MKKYIIITGGELYNKGAQSMTFTIIDRLKKIFPEKEIILLSNDYLRKDDEKKLYDFEFKPYRLKIYLNLILKISLFRKKDLLLQTNEMRTILKETFLNVDVSGFKLTSQFGPLSSIYFLFERKMMTKYKIKQYIFPQSFGPFDFKFPWNFIINKYLMRYMQEPEVIFCREKESYENLAKYTDKNIVKSFDTVFYHNDFSYTTIFKAEPDLKQFDIPNNSVGVVPNARLFDHNKQNNIIDFYVETVNLLLEKGNIVYIFRHSVEDLSYCQSVYQKFQFNERVILIEDDLNSLELQKLILNFKYIIASRYHAIIHAYINEVPAILIGWSFKYTELANAFNQPDLVFDIRDKLALGKLESAINNIETNHEKLSDNIKKQLDSIRKKDIFLILKNEPGE